MPTIVQLPDGRTAEFPDGMAPAEIEAVLRQQFKPASVEAGGALNEIPRQVGLAARSGLRGLGQMVEPVTEPIRQLVTDPLARAMHRPGLSDLVTGRGAPQGVPMSQLADRLSDAVGLPTPRDANERTVAKGVELGFSGAGMVGATRGAANYATGAAKEVLGRLSAGPMGQIAAGAGAGMAGQASAEAGGDGLQQTVAAVAGGLGGAGAVGLANIVREGAKSLGARVTASMKPESIDIQVKSILRRAGQDWDTLPLNVRSALRDELKASVATGKDLNADAVGRLADFMRVGAKPTRGTVTLDPVQITREKNLAKIGANSGDGSLHGLARIENENNATLINALNKQGAGNVDLLDAGRASVDSILGRDAAMGRAVSDLYKQARDLPGGDVPLDTASLLDNINKRLVASGKAAFLPDSIGGVIDQIRTGTVRMGGKEYPLNFDATSLDNLMTTIATAQRGTADGNVKAALSAVRQAIEDTPITPIKRQFGGNQLVTEPDASRLRAADQSAQRYMEALGDARSAARARFGWQESSRPVESVIGGMEPDKFVDRFVIGGTVADAAAVAQNAPKSVVRDALLTYLKDRSIGGAADEVGKFSQSAYNKALKRLGDEKLALFFSKEEIDQLRAIGRVASYTQVQPVGSAVNNSNSGALIGGRGLDLLRAVAGKVPFGQQAIVEPVVNISNAMGTRRAQQVLPGLLNDPVKDPALDKLMLPMLGASGLLAFD